MLYNSVTSEFSSFHASGDRRASAQTRFLTSQQHFGGLLSMRHSILQIEAFKVDKIRWTYYLTDSQLTFGPRQFVSRLMAKLREDGFKSRETWIPEISDQLLVEHIKLVYFRILLDDRRQGITVAEMTETFLRSFTHNLTAEGTPAPPQWSSMFTVLVNGPAFVPVDFEFNVPGKGVNERAWAYVEPYVKAYRRLSLGPRKLFITKKGRLGISTRSVLLESL